MAQTLAAPVPVSEGPLPRLWSVEEYFRMSESGLLGPEPRTELIDGVIYQKTSQGNAHILATKLVFYALQAAFSSGCHLAMQSTLRLEDGAPEPDILVLRGDPRDYDGRDPDSRTDVILVVEVSDTTLSFDQRTKTGLYARHGVAEYWIVNVTGRTLEVRRVPRADGYAETRVYAEGESVAVGGGAVAVADVLPKPTL